jgi:AhpC/TSA family
MRISRVLLVGLGVLAGRPLIAQQPTPPAEEFKPLEVGATAPDFTLPGATRFGLLRQPVHLSDFKGKTVVVAFFFKARTRG